MTILAWLLICAALIVGLLLLAAADRTERAQNKADEDRRIDNWKEGKP